MPGKVGAGLPGAVPRCAAVHSPCPAGPLRDGGPKRGQQPDGGKGQARVALVQSRGAGGLSWARATPGRSDNLGLEEGGSPDAGASVAAAGGTRGCEHIPVSLASGMTGLSLSLQGS